MTNNNSANLKSVSIIIPTYNRASLLNNIALKSALNQTYKNLEIIVVDDGSTDNTKEVVAGLIKSKPHLKYFFQNNQGQGAARNLGMRAATGEFILLLDADDYLLPEMVEIVMKYFNDAQNNYDLINCRRWVFDYSRGIYNCAAPNPSCSICRKSIYYELGFFDEAPELRGVEDVALHFVWDVAIKQQSLAYSHLSLSEPLVIYLEHKNQETSRANLEKLYQKNQAVLAKFSGNGFLNSGEVATRIKDSGNFQVLLGDTKNGRQSFQESLRRNFSPATLLLLIMTFGGSRFYGWMISVLKWMRAHLIYPLKLKKAINSFPGLYQAAVVITKDYQDW